MPYLIIYQADVVNFILQLSCSCMKLSSRDDFFGEFIVDRKIGETLGPVALVLLSQAGQPLLLCTMNTTT